jgi:hypothetical protein
MVTKQIDVRLSDFPGAALLRKPFRAKRPVDAIEGLLFSPTASSPP